MRLRIIGPKGRPLLAGMAMAVVIDVEFWITLVIEFWTTPAGE